MTHRDIVFENYSPPKNANAQNQGHPKPLPVILVKDILGDIEQLLGNVQPPIKRSVLDHLACQQH